MRYTIITPTIIRSTLPVLCDSIDRQTNRSWEHLIAVDLDDLRIGPDKRKILNDLNMGSRAIHYCSTPHKNFGSTCRREMSMLALGDYVLYIDDDNYYADDRVLETLETVVTPFASFALEYQGAAQEPFPVEASNVIVRRGYHEFPVSSKRNADQVFVQRLMGLEYAVIHDRPLVIVPRENVGRDC